MIFLTVGTSYPFDRLVKAVDKAVERGEVSDSIFAQIGKGGYRPINFDSVESLDKDQFDRYFGRAESVVSHAGMGTITMALERKIPILVAPRLKQYRELVNDHQHSTAKRFEQLGHVLAVYDMKDLSLKIRSLKSFKPKQRNSHPEKVARRIALFLEHGY